MNRNIALPFFLLLGLAVAFVGCDTNENEPIDEDLVGTWNATAASVDLDEDFGGVSVPVFEAGDAGELAITFGADSAFAFVAEGPIEIGGFGFTEVVLADGEGATITGTYAFSAGNGAVMFTPTEVDGQPIAESLTAAVPITFEDNDTVVLRVENTEEGREVLAFLLGGQIDEDILNSIESGSVTFRRDS